ncbi:hypothetical protein AB0469_35550 [Streptomyces sp. NPDC093801]
MGTPERAAAQAAPPTPAPAGPQLRALHAELLRPRRRRAPRRAAATSAPA